MKKFLLSFVLIAFCFAYSADAQIKTPAPSPSATVTQAVGMTDVMIEYSRPGVKGRQIFGDLVPYDKTWRLGANAATKLTISEDVTVQGKDLKKGSYAVFATPGRASWKVHFFPHTTNSAGGYGEAEAALEVMATPTSLPFNIESFTISVNDLKSDGASLDFLWSNVMVSLALGVHTDKQAMASIEKTLAGPTNGDFYNAGVYMASRGQDLEKALGYIQKATKTGEPRFWQVRQEAEVLAKLGRAKDAIAAAKSSLALAEKAGNADYVKINKDNIAKWMKM